MKKVIFIFGTRPEAIKVAPVIQVFKKDSRFQVTICITAQHREMLDQVLSFFDIKPDYDLNIMQPDQDLYTLSASVLLKLKPVLDAVKPDLAFVHGDTTTSTIASLACFYSQIKVAHIEAGLRTFNKHSPFPEEINRTLTGKLADFHLSPTIQAKTNLLNELVPADNILVTGNTVIDALCYTVDKMNAIIDIQEVIPEIQNSQVHGKRIILVTGHRRENHGKSFQNICNALKDIVNGFKDVVVIFPVHPNPNVRRIVYAELGNVPGIILIEPLIYQQFVWLMNKSYLILTDSGGIQEEAPTLGKPVLVMRDTTERPEALELGFIKLVGTDHNVIVNEMTTLLNDKTAYEKMQASFNPYGDGKASERIREFLTDKL